MSNESRTSPAAFARWQKVLLDFATNIFEHKTRTYYTDPALSIATTRINLTMALKAWCEGTNENHSDWAMFQFDPKTSRHLHLLNDYYVFEEAEVPTAANAGYRSALTIFNRVRSRSNQRGRPLPPEVVQFPPLNVTPIVNNTKSAPLAPIRLTDCTQSKLLPVGNASNREDLDLAHSVGLLVAKGYLDCIYYEGRPACEAVFDEYGLVPIEITPTLFKVC